MTDVPWLSATDQYARASIGACADALAIALAAAPQRADRPTDPPRLFLPAVGGEVLVMPSTSTGFIGVKLLTVADPYFHPDVPRIQGVHVQFDARTLAPCAILDGIALTNTRTAAVSVLALRALAVPDSSELLVFGAGPQAESHIRGICAEWPISRVQIVSRRVESARRLVERLRPELGVELVSLSDADVAVADLIVCATTSTVPVFSGEPGDSSATVAIGSHSPSARELPSALLTRAYVAVEERSIALRDAGDIVLAVSDGAMTTDDIDTDLTELVGGVAVDFGRPRVFKSVGQAWQDAVVAEAILAGA